MQTSLVVVVGNNGTKLIDSAILKLPDKRQIQLRYVVQRRPVRNGLAERFDGRLRDACLTEHPFANLRHARQLSAPWRDSWNHQRPSEPRRVGPMAASPAAEGGPDSEQRQSLNLPSERAVQLPRVALQSAFAVEADRAASTDRTFDRVISSPLSHRLFMIHSDTASASIPIDHDPAVRTALRRVIQVDGGHDIALRRDDPAGAAVCVAAFVEFTGQAQTPRAHDHTDWLRGVDARVAASGVEVRAR
ncbi:MAG: transposase [Pseudomonadota bacterium]